MGLFEFSSSLPLDLKIKQNPPKSCQIIGGGEGGGGRQARLLKSVMIWDEPFPKIVFHTVLIISISVKLEIKWKFLKTSNLYRFILLLINQLAIWSEVCASKSVNLYKSPYFLKVYRIACIHLIICCVEK